MTLTAEQLKKISPGTPLDRINTFLPFLNKHLPAYGIDTATEVASFLSQVLHESGGLKWMKELWGPSAQQSKYERDFSQPWPELQRGKRNFVATNLGNSEKGDGKLLMGRGPLQITGRKNYTRMSKDMFGDNRLLKNPDLLSLPEYGIQSACIYWKWTKMDKVDDDLHITQETKKVNGGYNGLDDRQKYFSRAISVFKIQ